MLIAMKFKNSLLSFLFIFSCAFTVVAQDEEPCQEIDDKKALKAYKEGTNKRNKKAVRIENLL